MDFRLFPGGVDIQYRILSIAAESTFRRGDTLQVGGGGVLLPVGDAPDESCLELSLTGPDGRDNYFMGEIMGVIKDSEIDWMCLKLHRLSKQQHDVATATGSPGPWIEVPSSVPLAS